jgi:hypothetical protein
LFSLSELIDSGIEVIDIIDDCVYFSVFFLLFLSFFFKHSQAIKTKAKNTIAAIINKTVYSSPPN